MALPQFTMRQLLEAGVHFGHHTRRWNPKMREYIFGVRNGVHIIDLQQTVPLLNESLKTLRDIVAKGGRVVFVGTKRQAQDKIAESAKRCGQFYVNKRWLGGMLTNWNTISKSIARLRELETILAGEVEGYTKKEMLMMNRERDKLEVSIGGIKDMGGQPDAMFVVDVCQEDLAIAEANKLGIPVFGIVDTNADPDGVDYIIPGNDDSLRAIDLYCDLVSDAVLDGLQAELAASGKDIGKAEEVEVKMPKAKKAKKEEAKKDDAKAESKSEEKPAEKAEDKPAESADEKKSEEAASDDAEASEEKPKKQATA